MPLLELVSPWDQQPQEAVEIDWANPISSGLALLHTPLDEYVAGARLTVNRPSVDPRQAGVAYSTSGAGGRASTPSRLRTSDGAGTGDFTIIVYAAPVASTTRQIPLCVTNAAGQSGESYLIFNSNPSYGPTPGGWTFTTFDGAPGIASAGGVDGRLHAFVVRRIGPTLALFLDGGQVESLTSTGKINTGLGDNDYIGGYKDSGFGHRDPLYQVGAWNRALTDAEIASLSTNPWQLFRRTPRPIFTPVGESGVLIPDLTSPGVIDITANTAKPELNVQY